MVLHPRQSMIVLSLIILISSCKFERPNPFRFHHYTVSTDLVQEEYTRYGTPAIADFDNDGDLDYAVSATWEEMYWFEKLEDHSWVKHTVGDVESAQLGGGSIDVDKDGWPDIVIGGFWFRNTHQPRTEAFVRYEYDSAIDREIHDLVFQDMDGDGAKDVVAMGDHEGCFWYDIPDDPLEEGYWEKQVITYDVLDEHADIHGGFFPGGVDDLDGDGDADVVLPGRWYRNEGKGLVWSKQFLPFGSAGYWGLSARSWIVDMDRDGDRDIVMVGCDQLDSRGAWLENNGEEVPGFKVHLLPLESSGRRGSFHSLWVADFDRDNDWDIFTIDQEDDQILPTNGVMRGYIWENLDGRGGQFKEWVVFDQKMGGHDVQFADVDADGDLDAYSKVWFPYAFNAYGGKPHVDFLENMTFDD